jgi:ribosome-associated protein
MLQVSATLAIDEDELEERFVLASGPGGQNVNKVSSAVQLRFDAARSPSLTDDVRARLLKLAGRRATKDGIIIVTARAHRAQERNRAAAREKLFELLRRAEVPPRPRRKTRVPRVQKQQRRDTKKLRAKVKQRRGRPEPD